MVVSIDVKGDLFDRLAYGAEKAGVRVIYWNPSDHKRSLSWNWFDEVNNTIMYPPFGEYPACVQVSSVCNKPFFVELKREIR